MTILSGESGILNRGLTTMDKIVLNDIHFEMKVGTTLEERRKFQRCRLQLTLFVSLEKTVNGQLGKTVDYKSVYEFVKDLCQCQSFVLLEEVALLICREVLRKFTVKKVKVKIGKVHTFSKNVGFVGVEVERDRSWLG